MRRKLIELAAQIFNQVEAHLADADPVRLCLYKARIEITNACNLLYERKGWENMGMSENVIVEGKEKEDESK